MGRVSKQTLETPIQAAVFNYAQQFQGFYPLMAQSQYAYDSDGRLTTLSYPGTLNWAGSVQPSAYRDAYTFTALGQMQTTSAWDGVSYDENGYPYWVNKAQGATYNAAGQILGWQENGYVNLTRTYDANRGSVLTIKAANIYNQKYLDLAYNYLPNGRVSSVVDAVNPSLSTTYGYEDRLNLAEAKATGAPTTWKLSWEYDEFGNRVHQTPLSGTPLPPQKDLSYDQATNRINSPGYAYL